jgi:hypothetical protein
MSAPKNSDPTKVYLSASRIDSFNECSQRYGARYINRLPDAGNDGSNRGLTCHDTLELLLLPRHHKLYSEAIHHDTCTEVPALWRFIKRKATYYGVADPENLEMIDGFMMVALKNEAHGPAGTIEAFSEREFNISVDQDGKRYNVRGRIDRSFVVKDKEGLLVSVTDFKGSKDFYQGEKATDNVQSMIYQLALRSLHPEITRRRFRFLFMKFDPPWQEMPILTDDQLDGCEYILTDLQERIEGFTAANISDNLPQQDPYSGFPCGKEGFKKDGKPRWVCPARRPMDYWVTVKKGKIDRSAKTEAELLPAREGETIEPRSYPGCVRFYINGKKIQSS